MLADGVRRITDTLLADFPETEIIESEDPTDGH